VHGKHEVVGAIPTVGSSSRKAVTSVVNVKNEEFDVYSGRACYGHAESKWANPYRIGHDGTRLQVIAQYRDYVLNSPELVAALPELKDKILGCWCNPLPCHGDVLVELVKNLPLRSSVSRASDS
jgi:hypothetical protein